VTDANALTTAIGGFADFLLKYAVVLAAAGALAMAIVELVKKLHDARLRFHARATTRWFTDCTTKSQAEGLAQLIELACGVSSTTAGARANKLIGDKGTMTGLLWVAPDPTDAAFALEIEQMVAVFQDSFDLVLTAPHRHQDLFNFITDAASDTDRSAWITDASAPLGPTPPAPDVLKERAERYARLRQAARRKLDAFQTFTTMRWVNWTQWWANFVGVVVLFAAFIAAGRRNFVEAAVFSLLGGMLAPVAKDLVVALQQVRQPVGGTSGLKRI